MRRRHAGQRHLLVLMTLAAALLAPACTTPPPQAIPSLPLVPPATETLPTPPRPFYLPHEGTWRMPGDTPTGRVPAVLGSIEVEGLGSFSFNPAEVTSLRPDIFRPGYFSVFDVIAHLADEGWFTLTYHFDRCLDTNVIDRLDGRTDWWYRAHYAGGWAEANATRMDYFLYKDGMGISLSTRPPEYMAELYNSFAGEVMRKSLNLGRVVVPEARVGTVVHRNVPVSAHNVRADVFQPDVVTALDVLLSLADQQHIRGLKLSWYSDLGAAIPVDSYFVEQIDDGDGVYDEESSPDSGGWVYETGSLDFSGYRGSHLRVPSDIRVICSPEYISWYWVGSAA